MSFEYLEAAKAVKKVVKGEANSKNAIFNSGARNIKRVYALVTETLKKRDDLERALRHVGLHKSDVDWGLLLVLAYELFFGAGKIKGGGLVKRKLVEQEAALRTALGVTERPTLRPRPSPLEAEAAEIERQAADKKPRWLRVNTLKASVEDVIAILTAHGSGGGSGSSAAALPPLLAPHEVVRDGVVGTVLRLPSDAHARLSLHSHPLVTGGAVILQDLASAMPVAALLEGWTAAGGGAAGGGGAKKVKPPRPFDAVDCCAAPGNKTTQFAAALAQLFQPSGGRSGGGAPPPSSPPFTVHAFDRDDTRLDLLKARVTAAGADGIITSACRDFLTLDPSSALYANVQAVVLDPSCSGSGMEQPAGAAAAGGGGGGAPAPAWPPLPSDRQAARVRSLSDFQLKALVHALSFPRLRRLVYSTCSVFTQEDEAVVAAGLAALRAKAAGAGRRPVRLVRALPSWPRRGVPCPGLTAEEVDACVRCHPSEDGTTGFFLAVFELG